MVSSTTFDRARGDIVRLTHRGLDVPGLSRAVTRVLARVVPFDGTCFLTIDPATLLPTGEIAESALSPADRVRLTEIELQESDFNKFVELSRAPRPAASLSEATAGDLDRSLRQRELRRPSGFDDELRVALSDAAGTWGALTLLRAAQRPRFTPAEVRFAASLGGVLADGVRRAMLLRGVRTDGDDDEDLDSGILVLAPDDTVEKTNRAAERWLDELGAPGRLPIVIHAVAGRARRIAGGSATDVAVARVRSGGGRWVVVRGSLLGDHADSPVAVLLAPARRPELAPMIVDAYGFSERERAVTQLVAGGFSTNEIAERLHVAAYTVQDHLKSIFEKSGTGSRGELVARLFFDHYAPRLTDDAPLWT